MGSKRKNSAPQDLPPSRIVIDRIRPSLNNGEFAVKRIVGESVHVQADVFADGHDSIAVRLCWRKRGERKWKETAMRDLSNDRYEGEFVVEEAGLYEYTVLAWVDHFTSWVRGLRKKVEDNQNVNVELLIGANLVEAASKRAKKADAASLEEWVSILRKEDTPSDHRAGMALAGQLEGLMAKVPDTAGAYEYPVIHPVVVDRDKAGFSAWYEFFPRSWASKAGEHGTFKDAEAVLPQIARMGFDVVYLPPIHPIGDTNRKGKNNTLHAEQGDVGSPWAIGSKDGGHKAVHPDLGTLADFKKFIKEADKNGLEIALDVAFQCSPDHPYVKEHPNWFKWRPDGTVQYAENPPKKYQDVLPFDFESEDWEALWEELKSVFEFWMDQGVKIFRVDNPHTKPVAFWDWLIAELKDKDPNVLLLSEAFTRPKMMYRLGKAGFTHGYTYFTWRTSKDELADYMTELTQTDVRDYFRPHFWPNTPDILAEHLQYGGRAMFISRLILAATLSSNYGIYGPAYELCINEAYPGKEEYHFSEKYELKQWNWDAPGNLKEIIARINHIRRENPALQQTNNISIIPNDNPHVLSYLKKTHDFSNMVLVVVNLDSYNTQSGWINLPSGEVAVPTDRSFHVHDQLLNLRYNWRGEHHYFKLEPHICPAHIFRIRRQHRNEQHFDYFM